jgi:RNA polymerase sigma-70 factor (ECF subfamily)
MIAKSRALDKLRSRRSRARYEEPWGETTELASPQASPEAQAGRTEDASRVRAALARLPREQREPLELAYYEGFTQSELSAKLGEPLGTIKTRMRAGLKRLRTELAPV